MNPFRTSAAAVLAALALAAVPATAEAHDGSHPFKNCTEEYDNGYSDIAKGDDHYGKHLDRDDDGIGCDQPPADFKPHEDDVEAGVREAAGQSAPLGAGATEDGDGVVIGAHDGSSRRVLGTGILAQFMHIVCWCGPSSQIRLNNAASAWPPPMHIVTTPSSRSRRTMSFATRSVRMAPVAPTG